VGAFVKQRIVALPDEELQGALGEIIVERRAWHR
jgi:hypothetical protein